MTIITLSTADGGRSEREWADEDVDVDPAEEEWD